MRKIRFVRTLSVAVLALLSAISAACSGSEQAPAATNLVFALDSEPERLSPTTIQNPQTFRVAWQLYEGLLGLTEDGQVAPRLAESWRTTDQQTWTFTLRPNVMFHRSELFGGSNAARAMTADDVVWSYTAFCAPGAYASFVLADVLEGCADYNAKKAPSVSGVRAVDARNVQLRLVKPEPFFLNRITTAWIAIFPKESAQSPFADRWGLSLAVGTGPFRLVSRTDVEIVIDRNPDYWDANHRPAVERVVFRVIKNDQLRLAELNRATVDIMPMSTTLAATIAGRNGELNDPYRNQFSLKSFSTFNHHVIGFNLSRVPDIHLRRAMSLAADRLELGRQLVGGFADITGGPVPPAMRGYSPQTGPAAQFNRDGALAELKQSSYKGQELELLVHDLANSEQIGAAFQQQMKAIGVNIRLTRLDFGSVIGRVIKGDATLFSMFAEIVFSSPEPLLINLFSSPKIPVPNFWKLSNRSIDAGLDSLRTITDAAARLRLSAEIERDIVNEAPAVFLYSQRHLVLYSRRISSLPVNPHEHYQLEGLRLAR